MACYGMVFSVLLGQLVSRRDLEPRRFLVDAAPLARDNICIKKQPRCGMGSFLIFYYGYELLIFSYPSPLQRKIYNNNR